MVKSVFETGTLQKLEANLKDKVDHVNAPSGITKFHFKYYPMLHN
jgi:hypothetical protein